ncbi:uncharacterized protein LOC142585868 [Dermacentor variabilis]|uniref:uncharacterized protein LOC142585868 n=1 Tax=Dermacentor variabilis TaxID=34621 RepID=UPI003F5C839B
MSAEVSETEEVKGNCDTGGDVDFTADVTDTKDWDDETPLEQTSLEHEYDDVQNGDAVSGDAEAGVVDEGVQAEATASADGETEMVEEEKQGEGGLATAEGTEEECAGAETENNSTEDKSELSYTCDMCKETFQETEEVHLKSRKHLKMSVRLEKFGSLEAVAAEFQPSVCYLCDVSAVSKSQMQMHVKGAKHKLRCANLRLPPSALDLPGTNRNVQPPSTAEGKSAGPPDPNAVLPERPVCDVCNITLSSVHQLMQHLSGRRHREIVNVLKQTVMKLPPNMRPFQLKTVLQKNDGKPPPGPAVKPAAPAPKPGNAVQEPAAKAVKRPAPSAGGSTSGPPKKPKPEQKQEPLQEASTAPSGAPAVKKLFSCDICKIRLNSEFQMNEHVKGRVHKDRLAEVKGGPGAGVNKPRGPQLKTGPQQGTQLGNKSQNATGVKQAQKIKGQQQPKPGVGGAPFWCNVCQLAIKSEFQFTQHMGSNRHRENLAHVARGPVPSAVSSKGSYGGALFQGANQHEFVPSSRQYRDRPQPSGSLDDHFRAPAQPPSNLWQSLPVQSQWKSPVLPAPAPPFPSQRPLEPAPSTSFGLLDPPVQTPREQGPYGLSSTQQFSKLQLDLALEISKLSQHLSRPEFSKELSQQLSHHITQELSRQRQMATDLNRPVREDERLLPHSERLPLLGDTPPLLEERTLLHDKAPLLHDKGPLLRDSYEDHALRRPPLLGESRPVFGDREQDYRIERRDERRPGIDSYGERRSRDYLDDYGKAYSGTHLRDLPARESGDYRQSAHSPSGGLLGRPPLLGSRF